MRVCPGWRVSGSGVPANATDILDVLQTIEGIYVRGDEWVYGASGYGSELVYMESLSLISPIGSPRQQLPTH
jgi:hypothetical protein